MDKSLRKAIIFDFDGTLVDSEKAIYRCFQSATKKIAPDRINYAKKILIGPPLKDTASSILGPNHQDQLDEFIKFFIEKHDDQAIFHTQPYQGVDLLLQKLISMKIPLAIATNKRQSPTIKLIKHFNWENYFLIIECSDSQNIPKNKDAMIKNIIKKNNIFKESYMIGDTVNDGLSANLNNLDFVRSNYGYGYNQDWSCVSIHKSVDNPSELASIFI